MDIGYAKFQAKCFSSEFVKIFTNARKEQGMTQQKLANITGMKQPNISRFEKDQRDMLTLPMLFTMAEALGFKVEIKLVPKK